MPLYFGTCSWDYDSWVGFVYNQAKERSIDYLAQYAQKYRMVEIDSWYNRLPLRSEVEEYAAAVDSGFRFMCKAPCDITSTHFRSDRTKSNPAFLSVALYNQFLESLEPIAGQISAIILEF